ncbi:MAG: sugar ABC transporter ATP-binding protein, partial [Pseudomonadota bacterium]
VVRGDGFSLVLDDSQKARLASRNLSKVTIGIRPSSFEKDSSIGSPITLNIIVSEYLGAQSVLVTRCSNEDVLVEYDSASPIAHGGTMTFGVKPEAIHLFDADTGLTL